MLNVVFLALFFVAYSIWPEVIGNPQAGCFAISMLLTSILKANQKDPEPLPPPPPPPPAPAKKPTEAPSAVPIDEKNSNAFQADEKRRILAAMPKKTQDTYGGDTLGAATVKKKTLLGGGTTGSDTTGA